MADKVNEYIVASEHVRHQDNSIFAHATLFATITGALVAFRYATNPSPHFGLQVTIYLAGILTSVSFWVNMEIYLYRFHEFLSRAVTLEDGLGYGLYKPMLETDRKLRPGTWAWRILFAFVNGFWTFNVLRAFEIGLALAAVGAILLPTVLQVAIIVGSQKKK